MGHGAAWSGRFFGFDEMFAQSGAVSAGKFDISVRTPNFRKDLLPVAMRRVQHYSDNSIKKFGARYAWESLEDGSEGAPNPAGFWIDHVFHMANIANSCWKHYLYTGDKKFLEETAYSSFRKASAAKDCKNIQQYYTTDRIVNIVGRDGQKVNFNPSKVKYMEYDINISESTTSPVFRQVANEFLMQVWQTGQISLKTMLEAGAFPFGDKLLSIINAEEQAMQAPSQPPRGEGANGRAESAGRTGKAGMTGDDETGI